MVAIGQQQPPYQLMHEVPLCRKTCLLILFLLFCHCRRHASFPKSVAAWTTWHNDQFGMEAAKPTALMLMWMLIVTSSEGYR